MTIAFFTDTYHPSLNGVTVSLDYFTEELEKQGHTVYIFAPKVRGYQDTRPNIIRLPSFKVLSSEPEVRFPLPVSGRSVRSIIRLKFDIVHAHGNGPFSLLGYQIAHMKGIPYVLTFHNQHTKYAHYFLKGKVVKPRMIAAGMRIFADLCDGIITPSLKMKRELRSYGVKKPIKIIPNFVPLQRFQTENTFFLHTLLSIPKDEPILLSVGRLGIEKNFMFLIKNFQKVVKKQPNSHLVIVGKGPEEEHLKEFVKSLKLEDKVHIAGPIPQEDMPKVYKDAAIFVFASISETQGVCVLEAACAGLPIIVADDLAYATMVKDGENGFVKPLTQKEFTDATLTLLQNSELRKKMGEESYKIAKKNYEGKLITTNLLAYYDSVFLSYGNSGKIARKVNEVTVNRLVKAKRSIYKIFN